MLSRTLAALAAVVFWLAPAGAHDTPDGRACCLEAPALECVVTSSSGACIDRPGVPVPGSLCCALGEAVDFGCLGTSCYTGPDGTEGVGACQAGSWSCSEEAIVCSGEVTPGAETCNGIDDDCNGITDEGFDVDLDGFSVCGGDCNDGDSSVFPGAAETCNGIDDDCDGLVDEASVDCHGGQNQIGICSGGQCQLVCSAGFSDCDPNPSNGCETDLSSNPSHCGACNNQCSGVCTNGVCSAF